MEKVDASKTSGNFYKTTRGHLSKYGNINKTISIRLPCLIINKIGNVRNT